MARTFTLATLLLAAAASTQADPGYYVVTAYPDAGEKSVEFRYWTVNPHGRRTVVWPELGFGYGVTSRWHTTLLASWIGSHDKPTKLSSTSWQNEVLLTQGEWPFDLALHTSLAHYRGGSGETTLEIGPAVQTDVGRTQLNANLFYERGIDGTPADPETKYQWQVRHRWRPLLHVGAQGFGERNERRSSDRAGPAVFSTFELADGSSIRFQAAYLVGKTYGREGSMFSTRLQLAF